MLKIYDFIIAKGTAIEEDMRGGMVITDTQSNAAKRIPCYVCVTESPHVSKERKVGRGSSLAAQDRFDSERRSILQRKNEQWLG